MSHSNRVVTYQVVRDRLTAGETAGDVARSLGLDVACAADCEENLAGVAVLLPGWIANDGNADVRYPGAESGEDAAQEYVDSGGWGDVTKTEWVSVAAWRAGLALDDDGDVIDVVAHHDWHSIGLEPEEPPCEGDRGHDWRSPHDIVGGCEENPGVWGRGGGVIIAEVCQHCGCGRTTDTWAQDPSTGVQGLTSVTYEEDKYRLDDERAS